jgi:hypothetical protein
MLFSLDLSVILARNFGLGIDKRNSRGAEVAEGHIESNVFFGFWQKKQN